VSGETRSLCYAIVVLSFGISRWRAGRIDQLAFAQPSSSGEFRYIPDIVSTQHRWS